MYYTCFRVSTKPACCLLIMLFALFFLSAVVVDAATCSQGYVVSGNTCVPDTNNTLNYFIVRADQDLSSSATLFGGYRHESGQQLYNICPPLGATAVRLFTADQQAALFSRVAWYPEIAVSSRHVVLGGQARDNWDWMTEGNHFTDWDASSTFDTYFQQRIFATGAFPAGQTNGTAYQRNREMFNNFDPTPPPGQSVSYPTVFYEPEPNAVTNITLPDLPGRLTMDVVSGYWHNSGLLYSPVYVACARKELDPIPAVPMTRVSLRAGSNPAYGGNWDTECARQASDGKQRAARITTLPKDLGFQAAANQDTTVPLLAAASFVDAGTPNARWVWLNVNDGATAPGTPFTNGFAFPNTTLVSRMYSMWAPSYPKSDADSAATRLTYNAQAGGWTNIHLPTTFAVACEPTSAAPDASHFYIVAPPAGWKQTTENMALMCYSSLGRGRLAQPTTAAKQASLEYVLATYKGADANTVGVFGLVRLNSVWNWVGSPQFYPDGVTPLADDAYTNWASGYPRPNVADGAVAGFSAAVGGWMDVDPASATKWVAVCEPLPSDEPKDTMDNIYLPSTAVTTLPLSGANAVMQACAAKMDPVVTVTSAATQRALKRYLLRNGVNAATTSIVVGGYFSDPAVTNGDWVWINSWDDSKPTAFTHQYASTAQPPATAVSGAYTNWAPGYPSTTTGSGRFVAFNSMQDGWVNTNTATGTVRVLCQTYNMTLAEAGQHVFLAEAQGQTAPAEVYRGHIDNLCPAFNGTLFEPNSILKQRALNMVLANASMTGENHYVGGEYNGTSQTDGMWNWASSGAFTQRFAVTDGNNPSVNLIDRFMNWQSGSPSGQLPTNGRPGNRFMAVRYGVWNNKGSTTPRAACTPGPSPYNYGIKITINPRNTVSPAAMCGEGYSPLIILNASVQAALERVVFHDRIGAAGSPLLSVRYNITTRRYVWLIDLRDPATAVASFVAGDTSDGSYQNWSPTQGLPTNSTTFQFVASRMKEAAWIEALSYTTPTYMACTPYTPPSDEQTSTLFLAKAPAGIAPPQKYVGSLSNLCRAYNATLFEPSSASRQDAIERAVNAKIADGMPKTTHVYFGAHYYGNSATGGVWAFESSNGSESGVFTTNFADGAVVAVNRYTGWAAGYPAGTLSTNGSPGPRFPAFRRDLDGWVNPTGESGDFYAACYTTTPPEAFNITVVPRTGTAIDSYSLCGFGRAPLIVLNASVQAALERKLILDGIPTSAIVLLGGLYNANTSSWTWVRDVRDLSTAVSVFGSANASAYTDWALSYPTASPESEHYLGFSASTGGWVNVASVAATDYVVCEPYLSPADEEAAKVFLVESRAGVAAPQTYAGNLEHLCPASNGTLYELTIGLHQDALEIVMRVRGVPAGANVYVGGRYAGETTQDGAWAWASGDVYTSKYGLDANASRTAVPSATAFTNWASANPVMYVLANDTPSARFMAMNSNSGGWVNPETETTAFYAACVSAPAPKDYNITIVPRSGTSLNPEALCGSHRAPLIVLNDDVQAALERKLITTNTDGEATVLLGGLYNTNTSSWTWVRDVRDLSTAVSVFGSANASAYTDWALNYPTASPESEHYLGFSASTGGWVNVASVSNASYVACEPYLSPADEEAAKVFLVESRAGVAAPQTYAGNLEHLCPASNGTLYELTIGLHQDALEIVMRVRGVPAGANVYVGGRYAGETTQDGAWAWASGDVYTSKYGLDANASRTAVPSATAFTNWASANPVMYVLANDTPSARFMAMNSNSGGWVNPETETTAFYAACVSAPAPKDYSITIVPRSGTSLNPEALCGSHRAPLIVLNDDVQAALERKLITTNTDGEATVLLGGLYNTNTSSWTWVRDARNLSSAVSVFGSANASAYTDWALSYPTASPESEHYLGFSASTGGWVNVASVAATDYVACEPSDYTPGGNTPTEAPKKKGFMWWPIVAAIVAAALIILLIIILCWYCRRKSPVLQAHEFVDTVTPQRARPPIDAPEETEKEKTVEMVAVNEETDVRVFSARPSMVSGNLNPLDLPGELSPEQQRRGPRRRNRGRRGAGLDVADVDLDFMDDANTNVNDDIVQNPRRRE